MRTAFVDVLLELAKEDPRVFLVTADLGWKVVDRFAERFPDRFLNVGVAEANMAGIATGLAQTGFIPFIYSIATFTSMRCYEQVRNGPILHHLPVRVVGIGGGYAYGHAGPTHYALEDLTIARTQPGMTVLVPADPRQTRNLVRATLDIPGPAYIRIGKGGNPEVPGLDGRFALNRPEIVKEGGDCLFIACGGIVHEALGAARILERTKISACVAVMAHIPFEVSSALTALLRQYEQVVTVEAGYAVGGLGSLVAETIAQEGLNCRARIMGIRRSFSGISGSEEFMHKGDNLDAESLARVMVELKGTKS